MRVLTALLVLSAAAFAEDFKPNVVIIFTDDQGTVDAGCYGSRDSKGTNAVRAVWRECAAGKRHGERAGSVIEAGCAV